MSIVFYYLFARGIHATMLPVTSIKKLTTQFNKALFKRSNEIRKVMGYNSK